MSNICRNYSGRVKISGIAQSIFWRSGRGFTLTEIVFSVLILAGTMIPIAADSGDGCDELEAQLLGSVASLLLHGR